MQCPDCEFDIGDARYCPECGWQDGLTSPAFVSQELLPESEEPLDANTDEDRQSDSEPTAGPPGEVTDSSEDEAQAEDNDQTRVQFDNKKSIIHGDQIGLLIKLFRGDQAQGEKSKHSLYTDTYEIGPTVLSAPDFIREKLATHLDTLKKEHLLVVGGEDNEIVRRAVHALIDHLGITDANQRRGYKVKERFEEDSDIDLQSFLPEKKVVGKKAAVIVDAHSNSGQVFVLSLLSDFMMADRLRSHAVYLLCIVDPAFINQWSTDSGRGSALPGWKIPCLHYLLKSKFPERHPAYERDILNQQKVGRWDQDETKLYYEVKSYVDKNVLPAEIELRKKPPSSPSPETVFKDEQCIEKTIIYTATYFPNVTLSEFCGIVEALLDNRKVLATIPKLSHHEDETIGWSHVPSMRPMVEIWREYKDQFMWRWKRLRQIIAAGDIVTIGFTDYAMREVLKTYLSSERKFYVKDQFDILQSKGFLFHPSNRVSDNLLQLAAETAASYPDEYNKDWLVAIISSFREYAHADPKASQERENTRFYFLDRTPFNKVSWGYSRIAEMIRQLLMKAPQTREMVNRALSDLMRLKAYDAVLDLIKRLRFAPDFDGLYWLKQLFDRGELGIRVRAFNYLYDQARGGDADIYETLRKLESWLPAGDRETHAYPSSALIALRLLIKYCLETTYRFKQEQREAEYVNCPLFVFADKKIAEDNLDQLVRWLLHPALGPALRDLESDSGMKNALVSLGLEKKPIRLLGALMAEWSMILLRSAQATGVGPGVQVNAFYQVGLSPEGISTPAFYVGAAEVDSFRLLIEKIASQTNETQQRELIVYWEAFNQDLLHSMTRPECSIERRSQLYLKSSQMFYTIQEFKKLISILGPMSQSASLGFGGKNGNS
jgi:hypothetical protein